MTGRFGDTPVGNIEHLKVRLMKGSLHHDGLFTEAHVGERVVTIR